MIVDLDDRGWSHLMVALKNHRRWCREAALEMPPVLLDMLAIAQKHDRDRQEPTTVAGFDELLDDQGVRKPLALTLTEAATRLRVSKRTVERLVADETLPSVTIGGARRIRVADLEAYLATLANGRSFRSGITRKQAS